MTTRTNRIEEIFQDARELQADALEMLAQGRIRNAAEKAWGATKRATDVLVLARRPERSRSGRRKQGLGSGSWYPWTKLCGKPTCSLATTAGRDLSTASASTTASATPWRTLSAGYARQSGYIDDAERLAA